ncbi:MAG: UDP-N-acetylglucosamine 1-carboxyvinyltransferase [Anaerolineaceae bacterium]|nr:UDP-N-acetylglucosamine 1-carboxyvinyltransferase [Anaerolineaceae bacterium]
MRIRVEGQQELNGVYHTSGNPNAALALLAASLMTDEPVTLHNMPSTTTIESMLAVGGRLGATFKREKASTTIQTAQISKRELSQEDTNGLVSALLYLAPILVRRQYVRVEIDFPLSRIRTHLEAFRDLGLETKIDNGALICQPATWDKKEIILSQASVTATAIVMMLAARLGQETMVYNAACEPHVQELAHMLVAMGVQITGIGSNRLCIYGADHLKGTVATIGADHIEAASIAAIAALCSGRVEIDGIHAPDMRMIQKVYKQLGIRLDIEDTRLFIPRQESLALSNQVEDTDLNIETSPWPAFPSDLVAMATLVATQARGSVLIHEKLFNNRLLFVDKLKAMGGQIVLCDPHRAIVIGPTTLHGVYLDSPDVRAGLGMLGAALVARGETVIDNAQAIDRTFGNVFSKLQTLGARITIE